MATGSERYRKHKVWETLKLKREALNTARFGDAKMEQWRTDIVEWLTEASKTKLALQPALYLSALDELNAALNTLTTDTNEFKRYVGLPRQQVNPLPVKTLEAALRALPLPPPKNLSNSYVELLDKEVEARTARLNDLEGRVAETEFSLQDRLSELQRFTRDIEAARDDIQSIRAEISDVRASAETSIREEWGEALDGWRQERERIDFEHNAAALKHIASLAAITNASGTLAEHAAGELSATDWYGRAKRERRAAQWMRAGAAAAFTFAGAVGWFIVDGAIRNDFDLTVGDGILRSAVAVVIGAFGGLLLRESSRHFREADTAEDVALSLKALAPFYANSDDQIRLAARVQVGDAVLVKNILSRFAHRDAARHAGEINTAELPGLVREATQALKDTEGDAPKP